MVCPRLSEPLSSCEIFDLCTERSTLSNGHISAFLLQLVLKADSTASKTLVAGVPRCSLTKLSSKTCDNLGGVSNVGRWPAVRSLIFFLLLTGFGFWQVDLASDSTWHGAWAPILVAIGGGGFLCRLVLLAPSLRRRGG